MRFRKLKKRIILLEARFHCKPKPEEFDVDWNMLSEHERDVLHAAARVEIKYRVPRQVGVYDFSNASEEEKAVRILAQGVMQNHLEKKSVIEERYYQKSIH